MSSIRSVALVSGAALLAAVLGVPPAVADRYTQSDTGGELCNGEKVTLRGTEGPDHLVGTSGSDVIWGGPGNDIIRGQGGDDVVCAGAGADYIALPGRGRLYVLAGKGADVIHDGRTTTAEGSVLRGGQGPDTILGSKAAFTFIRGGGGRDLVRGRGGFAHVSTGPGHDVVHGGPGGSQVDDLTGTGDAYYGGPSFDTAIYSSSRSGVRVSLVSGRGRGLGRLPDRLFDVEDVVGSRYGDVIIGNAGRNGLSGDQGRDLIFGRNGPDLISGGVGNDTLDGGLPDQSAAPTGDVDHIDGGPGDADACTRGEVLIDCELTP